MQLTERVGSLVPATGVHISGRERDMILEIAYLAIATDRKLSDPEIAGFAAVSTRLRGLVTPPLGEPADDDLDEQLSRFAQKHDADAVQARLEVIATDLRQDLRSLAYKVAYALSLCDLEASDEEFEFDLTLIDALELSNEEAQRLALEVEEAFRV
jgi:hypothetical protein